MMLSMFVTFAASSSGAGSAIGIIIGIIVAVIVIAGFWRVNTKAGEPGWAAIIPIYNLIVLLRIVGRPVWWFLLLLIPGVNLIILIIVYNDLSKSFGHGVGFTLGLIFLSVIFVLILGYGSSTYRGPAGTNYVRAV
ncbi:MAG: DUF5684 domain-containing protein [Thermomicrobiales bacterium]